MGIVHYIGDSLRNMVSKLGTARDKASHSEYVLELLSDASLLAMYRSAWLPRKIVDIPAYDSCRNWRAWQADAPQIEAIEKEERRLAVREKMLAATITARLLGGCAILIGTGETRLDQPLNPTRLRRGGIRYLTVLSPLDLTMGDIEDDPTQDFFGRPRFWRLNTRASSMVELHPSRLVLLRGAELPRGDTDTARGWGDSVLQTVYTAVRSADATSANIASLVFEAKVDVVRIPGLMDRISDARYEASVLKRFTLASAGKGVNGTLILDKEEEYQQKSASFATLPDIMDRFYQIVAGAADIPVTRLMGRSAAGLNATGEGDLRNYYDRIRSEQELHMGTAMAVLDECLIQSALGSRPAEVGYTWNSLWQTSQKELADVGKTTADTLKTLSDAGLFSPEVLSETAANAMAELGVLPGLESAIEQFGLSVPDPTTEEQTAALQTQTEET